MELEVSESGDKMPHLSIKWYPGGWCSSHELRAYKTYGASCISACWTPTAPWWPCQISTFMQSHSMMESQKNGDKWKKNLGSHVGFNLSFCPVSQRAFQTLLTPKWLEEVSKEDLLTFCLSCLHSISVTITIVSWDSIYLLCISFAQKHATALLSYQVSSPSWDFFQQLS